MKTITLLVAGALHLLGFAAPLPEARPEVASASAAAFDESGILQPISTADATINGWTWHIVNERAPASR
jgi:hypothetical protein